MRYMLDTNICIFIIKNKPETVRKKLESIAPGDIAISSVTHGELCHGVEKSQDREKNRLALAILLARIPVLPFTAECSEEYGKIRADLERNGTPIGPLDTLIAAHAKALDLTLVTNNVREFVRVEGLNVEDWTVNEL